MSSPDHSLNPENPVKCSSRSLRRVTRSSARLAVDPSSEPPPSNSTRTSISTRKRKASNNQGLGSSLRDSASDSSNTSVARKAKRHKPEVTTETISRPGGNTRRRTAAQEAEMSPTASSSKSAADTGSTMGTSTGSGSSSKRKGSRSKKPPPEPTSSNQTNLRSQKKKPPKKEPDNAAKGVEEESTSNDTNQGKGSPPRQDYAEANDAESPHDLDEDVADPFGGGAGGIFGRGAPLGMSSTLRALSGMMSGMSSRLRDILNNLKQRDDTTTQLVALEELSNLLLVSNEDNLSGQFSPDPYVKELIVLMQPNEITGEENPEMMLLACRCIANLMEALRGSVANVVYGGAVPILCQKLLEIHYIDVAEQALSTLSKISVDFPGSIVREGGLAACLQFLDFFATGTQRTAVTTAANCCRRIPHDSFSTIRDVMPILQNVLVSPDQKVVEQGCLCVTRIIDSFKHSADKLEELVDAPLLKLILGLLLPGTTNLIGPNIHTEFLRVLAIVARASPRLSTELLKMQVVDTLYQILTGISPPDDTSNAASKIDTMVIMQSLVHRPREQVYETLNVICELLPPSKLCSINSTVDKNVAVSTRLEQPPENQVKEFSINKRLELLETCASETRRFAVILLPTLADAYSSTVNLSVRQKVLTAHLKMLSNFSIMVIEEALQPVPYASFLASILSQQDHPSLVLLALQATELLLDKLQDIYQYQFYREGVIAEIKKLASKPMSASKVAPEKPKNVRKTILPSAQDILFDGDDVAPEEVVDMISQSSEGASERDGNEHDQEVDEDHDAHEIYNEEDVVDDDDDDVDGDVVIGTDCGGMSDSPTSDASDSGSASDAMAYPEDDIIILRAEGVLERYETTQGREMRDKATHILEELKDIAKAIRACYKYPNDGGGRSIFERLASFFHGDALENITSSELLSSGIIQVFLEIFKNSSASNQARGDFVETFIGQSNIPGKVQSGPASRSEGTAFSVLIQKVQELLSRSEHFEVLTSHSNASDNSSHGSSAAMLARQLRLKLTADADSDIPPSYRDITVSIHGIATFKALDDYLRPRISLSERPSMGQRRREMLATLASARMRELPGASNGSLFGLGGGGGALTSSPSPSATLGGKSKTRRFSSRSRLGNEATANEPSPTANSMKSAPRRSSRRLRMIPSPSASQQQIASNAAPPSGESSKPLECADEKKVLDAGVNEDISRDFEAVVDGIDDEVSENDGPEPSAINMEIASTGKVTARKEDGTRIATPMQAATSVPVSNRPDSATQPVGTQSARRESLVLSGRHLSYAAALAAPPQDWHIEFSVNGKPVPKDTTIYRAVYFARQEASDSSSRSVWSGVHTIAFKRVKGPSPDPPKISSARNTPEHDTAGVMPLSLDGHPTTSSILSLLAILHEMNSNLEEILGDAQSRAQIKPEPLTQFINTKLTAKMNRQLEEPLIVASNCLPSWSEDLARLFPFLFPFETRHLFLQSTSFGYSRSMVRWQSSRGDTDDRRDRRRDERPIMGRLQRQKVRISRSRILESGLKVMEMYGGSPSVLEVEYFEEVGTGLGPTLEFYSTVSKEFSKKKLKMWRENESSSEGEYAFGRLGLFPAPLSDDSIASDAGKKLLHLFKTLGSFVARSMLDSRIIDIPFNSTFFRLANGHNIQPSIALVRAVDHGLGKSLMQLKHFVNAKTFIERDTQLSKSQKEQASQDIRIQDARIEDLMLDFTLPGYPAMELIPNGSNTPVTLDNISIYLNRVLDLTVGAGVAKQIDAFKAGFSEVFSYSSLRAFTPDELTLLFGQVEEDWSLETLMDSIKADHGFNLDSKTVKHLLQTMSEFESEQRRDFLQFVTGSPRLPIGGFKSLTPMFTVVCKPSEPPLTSDDYLPSVMTCVNYLKLPDYSDLNTLRQRLQVAIKEGQGAFHLS